MKHALPFFALALLSLQVSALELAKHPQVFDAGKGVSLALAPTADGKQALVQVRGINHPLDEVVFLTEVQELGNEQRDYGIRLDGRDYNLLNKRRAWGGESYQLNLPDTQGFELSYDEEKSKALKPADLLALYEKQEKDGVQARLAAFDRKQRVADYSARLQEMDSEASKACGTPLATQVDWSALSDEQLIGLSVPSFCGEVVNQMAYLCEKDDRYKAEAKTLKGVDCRFGERLKLHEKDGRLQLTTHADEANQGDFINAILRNR
ncbi:hypothetical protein OU800_00390 [Pseudomonas sp. GOM7]|uniref:hypothetical protein n=1 Tax=unclassified Pseudomonas TaxID=196821 RepID=UPI00227A3C56|nr:MULTISPECIES: hypothetical protein [unclassified Pseudomonas]WAJ37718.1 hypothetical protein OU800_00390 [Pseudomonas sp. GOM7]